MRNLPKREKELEVGVSKDPECLEPGEKCPFEPQLG